MGFRHCEPCGGAQKVTDGKCSRCNKPFPDTSTRARASEPVVVTKQTKNVLPPMKEPPRVVSLTVAQQLDARLSEKGKKELSNADDSELTTPPISPPPSPRQVHSSQADGSEKSSGGGEDTMRTTERDVGTTGTDRSANVQDSVGDQLPLRFNPPEDSTPKDSTPPLLTSRDKESLARFLQTYRRLCLVGHWGFELVKFILIVCVLCVLLYVSVKMYQNVVQCYNGARNHTIVVNMTPYFVQMENSVSFIGNNSVIPSLTTPPWTAPVINFTEQLTNVGDSCVNNAFEHFANFTLTNATATLTNATTTLTNATFTTLNTWPTSRYIATVGIIVAVPAQVPLIGVGACAIGLIEAVPQVAAMVKDTLL